MPHLAVFEAVIVAAIMITSVAYVSMVNSNTDRESAIEDMLTQRAEDFLSTAAEEKQQPSECGGTTRLEQLLIDGVNGDHTLWDKRSKALIGPGIDADLYLDNGYGLYPLHARGGFMGSTAEVNVDPAFSFVRSFPRLDSVAGTETMQIDAAPVSHGEVLRAKGEAIATHVNATEIISPLRPAHVELSTQNSKDGFTALSPNDGGSISLEWLDSSSHLLGVYPIQSSNSKPANAELRLGVHLLGRPANTIHTRLEISFPPGWSPSTLALPLGWDASTRSRILTLTAISNFTADVVVPITATPPSSPVHPFDVIHAQAYNTSLAQADLVVEYQASTETTFPRSVYTTTPYPIYRGTNATFGLVYANGAQDTTVTNVTIAVPGGYDFAKNRGQGAALFEAGRTVTTQDGTWRVWDAKHASLETNVTVPQLTAASWFVDLPITSDERVTTSFDGTYRGLPTASATFPNGFVATSDRWGDVPGILRLDVPNESIATDPAPPHPAGDGYPHDAGTFASSFDVDVASARAHLSGEGTYNLTATSSNLVALQTSVANSTFGATPRAVPLGTQVTLGGDLQSLLTTLASQGVSTANLTLDVYAPPSMGCKPTASWTWDASTLPVDRLNDVRVWHGPTEAVFVASNDGHVYELLPGGGAGWQWQAPDAAKPVKLALAAFGSREELLVGDDRGRIASLDPSFGTVLWSTDISPVDLVPSAIPAPVRVLRPNSTAEWILASAGSRLVRLDANGALVASASFPAAVTDAQEREDGGALVLAGALLVRVDSNLGTVGGASALGTGLAFARGTRGVLVVRGTEGATVVNLLDRDTLAILDETPEPFALAGASGDATGDGVEDLVLVLKDGAIVTLDGETGAEAWRYDVGATRGEVRRPVPAQGTYSDGLVDCGDTVRVFAAGSDGPTPCAGVALGSLSYRTTSLVAGAGRVVFAGDTAGDESLLLDLDANGTLRWTRSAYGTASPAIATLDSYSAMPVILVGTRGGDLFAYPHDASLPPILHARPGSNAVGKFAFTLHVPMGGFFGSHVAVATLAWNQEGKPQAAHLVDWFEVVQPDGTPREHPTYRVSLVVADRGAKARER